ncbi:hypothetical protein EJ06DRAFT_308927 [Trichodelitschia bisporula]|uniref:Uncharacterized protein n=1 Tax=Trichodelitschia bisporula TaxID=703511 RepID=A0A6G1I3Z9_9PEZI|nr:hypothetical protein EJ06DRAFT_308927 [Trichodelitschia bisporula]
MVTGYEPRCRHKAQVPLQAHAGRAYDLVMAVLNNFFLCACRGRMSGPLQMGEELLLGTGGLGCSCLTADAWGEALTLPLLFFSSENQSLILFALKYGFVTGPTVVGPAGLDPALRSVVFIVEFRNLCDCDGRGGMASDRRLRGRIWCSAVILA